MTSVLTPGTTWQPQAILRYSASDNLNLYASYSRGFRSRRLQPDGRRSRPPPPRASTNVGDLFDQETADTYEVGFKSRWFDDRLIFNGSVYITHDKGDYYFVFLASNSTQNLGNIEKVDFTGFDLDATARSPKI